MTAQMVREWDMYNAYLKYWADSHKDYENYSQSPVCFQEFCDNELQNVDFVKEIEKYLNKIDAERFKNIAYNAITFSQLDEQYSYQELKDELCFTDEEWLEIADGDENMEGLCNNKA